MNWKYVLAVQSMYRVSIAQAELFFQRQNPNFKTLNYSNTVHSNQGQSKPASSSTINTSYTPRATQSFQSSTLTEYLKKYEKTCQNNLVVKAEAKIIFKDFSKGKEDDFLFFVFLYQTKKN